MKSTFKIIILLLFVSSLTVSCNKKQDSFYHVLMIEFTQEANMVEITNEILGFKNIPSVLDLSFGKIQKNDKNKIGNFKYCLMMKFENKKGLDTYLKDPYHQKVYKKHKPLIADIYIADFNPYSLKE